MSDMRDELEAEHFRTTVGKDLSRLAIGALIGTGAYRHVYEWLPDPSLVLKIENGAKSFANVIEDEVWNRVRDTEFARWFAPVVQISDCGSLILQKRTEPIRREELPELVPAFFTDLHIYNWGLLNGRPVCHDYGLNLLMERGMTKRMRKAGWR